MICSAQQEIGQFCEVEPVKPSLACIQLYVQYILINFWCTAHYHCTVSSDTQKSSELLILDPIHPELNIK